MQFQFYFTVFKLPPAHLFTTHRAAGFTLTVFNAERQVVKPRIPILKCSIWFGRESNPGSLYQQTLYPTWLLNSF